MSSDPLPQRFRVGDPVRVKPEFRPGHLRTPWYIRGKVGVIDGTIGNYWNPETSAQGSDGRPERMVYHVCFKQTDLWPDYHGKNSDELIVDIQDHWLDAASMEEVKAGNLS